MSEAYPGEREDLVFMVAGAAALIVLWLSWASLRDEAMDRTLACVDGDLTEERWRACWETDGITH